MATGLSSEVTFDEETPVVRQISTNANLALGIVGISERGDFGVPIQATSFDEFKKKCGSYTVNSIDCTAAVQGYFDNGGNLLYFARALHCTDATDPTTKTSNYATINLMTTSAAPTSGVATSGVGPWALAHGQTVVLKVNALGNQTGTISATAASRQSGAAGSGFVLADLQTLLINVDGVALPLKTFHTAEFSNILLATAQEVVNSLNAFFASNTAGCVATVTASDHVTITSNRKGLGSGVNIVSGTANAGLGFTTGNQAGGGNVSNVAVVTVTEVIAIFAALPLSGATATNVGGALRFTSSTTGGTSIVQLISSSTALIGFDFAQHTGLAGTPVVSVLVDAKSDGVFGNALQVQVLAPTDGAADRINLYVWSNGVVKERFFNVSFTMTDSRYIESVINDSDIGSDLIKVTDQAPAVPAPGNLPAIGLSANLAGGDDGLSGLVDNDFIGGTSTGGDVGFRVLDAVDIDVMIVPGKATSAIHNAMVTYAEITRAGLCFCILDPPAATSAAGMITYVKQTASLYQLTEMAAMYWPRIKVLNPSQAIYGSGKMLVVPPSGMLAGLYARVDSAKIGGAFDHPAGTDLKYLPKNVLGLESDEVKKKPMRDLIFPSLINPISKEDGPYFVDGARTLRDSGNWPTIGQRRGIIFVEKRLIPGLAFIRHRNIQPKLLGSGTRTVLGFLGSLASSEAFASKDPKKAFFVDFGPALNTAATAKRRTVYARLGIAAAEPAEFVCLLISPDTRALDEELAALTA